MMDCAVVHPYHSGRFGSCNKEPLRPGGLALTRLIIEYAGFVAGEHILDLGCGEGAGTQLLQHHGCNAIGLDTSQESLVTAAERQHCLAQVTASALSLPFPDACLDGIVAECLLSLIEQRAIVLAECYRVLHRGGRLAVTDVYAREAVSSDVPRSACLTGLIRQKEILSELVDAGFRVERWEDHSPVLKAFMARLIFECDEQTALWAGNAVAMNAELRKFHPGYFLLIAIKD